MKNPNLTPTTAFAALAVSTFLFAAPASISTITEYFDLAKTKPEYQRSFYMINGEEIIHGTEAFWFFDGTIEGKSNYKDGKKDGESFWNYQNGDIRWSCVFSEGTLLHGKFYHHEKKLASEIKEGNGQWKEFDEATGTKLVYIADYVDGVKNGKEINYDENGEIYSTKDWERGILESEN